MQLSVIIPVFNEALNIQPLHQRLTQVVAGITDSYELIFINDGSQDATLERVLQLAASDSHVRYIDFSRNFGHQVAVSAGLDHCSGEAVVIIDADLQDPPELIPQMYALLSDGYEVVYARRNQRRGESWFKKFTASLFYRLLNRMARIEIPLDTGDFRIMRQVVVHYLRRMPEMHKFLRGQISWIGFKQTYVRYDRDARHAGSSNYPFRKMLRFALDGITGFSTTPLKIATVSGFVLSVLAFVFMLVVIVARIFSKELGIYIQPGWASTMVAILFLGGIQMLGMGVLGEYIGRINENIKNRPLYIVRDKSDTLGS